LKKKYFMSKVFVLGATGSLGLQVIQQAVAAGHSVSVVVRTASKLPVDIRSKLNVQQCDLENVNSADLTAMLVGHDAVINTAGHVNDGEKFVGLIDKVVSALEALPVNDRPTCWFLAGAGLLDFDEAGRRGVDISKIRATYWPHSKNFERINRSNLNWRLLCPGPLTDQPPLGVSMLRTSLDCLPVKVPGVNKFLPSVLFLPVFGYLIPEMIISYADAASLMLSNLDKDSRMSGHRVGVALPVGMRGKKSKWVARQKG
jgi:uncharacterized protein